MKRIMLLGIISIIMFSCKSTVDSSSQRIVKGYWTLTNVSYSEQYVKAKAFGYYDAKCLEGTSWRFISNNNQGNFTINKGGDCPVGLQQFTWYIDQQGQFIVKNIGEGEKARKIGEGVIYQIQNLSESTFNLVQSVNGITITYHYIKDNTKK